MLRGQGLGLYVYVSGFQCEKYKSFLYKVLCSGTYIIQMKILYNALATLVDVICLAF